MRAPLKERKIMFRLKFRFLAFILLVMTLILPGRALAGQTLTLMLDWYPNPDHVPIYLAAQNGYFAEQNIKVDIQVPADPNDPLKLVAAGRVDFAISYQPGVLMAEARGLPVVSLGALVQHPLSSVLYLKDSGIQSPADFKGKTVGYSVEPLYRVFFEAMAEKAGLAPADYETVLLGYNLMPPLLSGQIAGACGAFRNYEAVQIELMGKRTGIFPFEDFGLPDFYELVIIANRNTMANRPEAARKFMAALTRAIQTTCEQPEKSFQAFLKMNPDLDDELNRRAFQVTLPFFRRKPRPGHQPLGKPAILHARPRPAGQSRSPDGSGLAAITKKGQDRLRPCPRIP